MANGGYYSNCCTIHWMNYQLSLRRQICTIGTSAYCSSLLRDVLKKGKDHLYVSLLETAVLLMKH